MAEIYQQKLLQHGRIVCTMPPVHDQGGCLKSETLTRCWLQRSIRPNGFHSRDSHVLVSSVGGTKQTSQRERGGESRFLFDPLRMSIKIMQLVWEYAPYSGGKLLVLLALAD